MEAPVLSHASTLLHSSTPSPPPSRFCGASDLGPSSQCPLGRVLHSVRPRCHQEVNSHGPPRWFRSGSGARCGATRPRPLLVVWSLSYYRVGLWGLEVSSPAGSIPTTYVRCGASQRAARLTNDSPPAAASPIPELFNRTTADGSALIRTRVTKQVRFVAIHISPVFLFYFCVSEFHYWSPPFVTHANHLVPSPRG